jgi:hypothetical protein
MNGSFYLRRTGDSTILKIDEVKQLIADISESGLFSQQSASVISRELKLT